MKLLAAGEGFHVPPVTELFSFKTLAAFDVGPIHFRINFLTILMFALTALLAILFVAAFRKASIVPSPLQNAMEAAVGAIRENIVHPTLGAQGEAWLPFLATMFFFTLALNFMAVVPGIQIPLSSRMAIPVSMSLMTYVIFNVVGIKTQGPVGYFKNMLFPPGVPKPVYIILSPIELFSTMINRPLTLAVRLFANMMAGHVMLTIFFLASAYFLYRGDSLFLRIISPFPFVLSVILVGFEIFIGLIQAFIITILTGVYIAGALHPEH
jgi:F-type H+-transporting ATPase subunit a